MKNCQKPEFAKKLEVDYYFERVQKLKFGIYDIDNKSSATNDDDYLGGVECTLGQVTNFVCCWFMHSALLSAFPVPLTQAPTGLEMAAPACVNMQKEFHCAVTHVTNNELSQPDQA